MPKKTTIAKLRNKITIESKTRVSDGIGGYTTSWNLFDSPWADIIPLSGYEKLKAGQQESNITHKIIIRYVSGITAEYRIKYGTREFAIKYTTNYTEGQNSFLELRVVEGEPS